MILRFALLLLAGIICNGRLIAGELYYSGFDSFAVGNDTIAGSDGWTGSSSHAGLQLSGVDSETDHLVAGIGKAAFIGGNNGILAPSVSRTVNVRKSFNIDPVAQGNEVARFHATFGIKDSTYAGSLTRRDNFEFAFYNSSGQLIAFLQFDNSTLTPGAQQAPAQKIWRSNYQGGSLVKVDTGVTFFYDVLMELSVRINFRTNRWSVILGDLAIFNDQPFYTGPNLRTLGTVAAQLQIVGTAVNPVTMQSGPAPGDNYMLFDDFAVRVDPVPAPTFFAFALTPGGEAHFAWQMEALYLYKVQYSEDMIVWANDLPGSSMTATLTGQSPIFSDVTATGRKRRFYRVTQMVP
jgi:hypothetical protein